MSKYKQGMSKETIEEANKLAKANQRPSQTKEQTKIIAQGIQKGIDQYKKQHKSKLRELDRRLKIEKTKPGNKAEESTDSKSQENDKLNRLVLFLPWGLLFSSWVFFIAYLYLK